MSSRNGYTTGYAFRQCRLTGHAWFPTDMPDIRVDPAMLRFALPMSIACENCGTIRVDWIDKGTGDLAGRRYVNRPVGFGLHRDGDMPLPKKADWRLSWLDDHIAEMREERKARRGLS